MFQATPFPGRKKSIAKSEGVTRIGNNTYYYTGEKDQEGATADGNADTEEELDDRPEGKRSYPYYHSNLYPIF